MNLLSFVLIVSVPVLFVVLQTCEHSSYVPTPSFPSCPLFSLMLLCAGPSAVLGPLSPLAVGVSFQMFWIWSSPKFSLSSRLSLLLTCVHAVPVYLYVFVSLLPSVPMHSWVLPLPCLGRDVYLDAPGSLMTPDILIIQRNPSMFVNITVFNLLLHKIY